MRKYWEVSKIYMKTQLVWRADVIFNMIFTIGRILFAYLLWGIIFGSREKIGVFTFHSMLSYYIVSSFLSQLEMSGGISGEIHERIRNGTFSKYMVIPVGIQRYFMAMELGVVLFYILFDLTAAVVWVFVFRIEFVFAGNAFVILCAAGMAVLGMLFMVQLNFFLGLLTLKYQGIGAFYIADRLGMPNEMLRVAIKAAYGEFAIDTYKFLKEDTVIEKRKISKVSKIKKQNGNAELSTKYKLGDSVMVYPDKKIGIVCEPVNEKGVLRVQLPDKKIWINHKRVKLHVAAAELYPEDYDFSIIFDTVENRKIRHDMDRKYTEKVIKYDEK